MSHHKPLRLPSAFTVNHDLEGATFRHWLHFDRTSTAPIPGRYQAVHAPNFGVFLIDTMEGDTWKWQPSGEERGWEFHRPRKPTIHFEKLALPKNP